jgi:hypothetical protein
MPGWYIHMDVARKALGSLSGNVVATNMCAQDGYTAQQLQDIAKANPAYVALGAIGPDMFFLLPDFKPPPGSMLWGAANTINDLYSWWDENFLSPYEDQLGPSAKNAADELGALTGGLSTQLSAIFSRAFKFLLDTVAVTVVRQYDVFSFLGSGVPEGYDEQAFFWSDMLHYRKTYEFARQLWNDAQQSGNDRFRAFALGWMSHLATDVAGHCFVNEKSGGPYRLHWQRHHLVENHMDAKVYDSEHGAGPIYQMLSCAALHLWIAFNPDGSSRVNFFDEQPGPAYVPGHDTPSMFQRNSKWDFDSGMPPDLAAFIANALQRVYKARPPGSAPGQADDPKGPCSDHPTIISAIVQGHDGFAHQDDIVTTYWWLYHYVKFTTTDYFALLRPDPPSVFNLPPFPSPPGAGESDPGPGAADNVWHDSLEILLAIFAWIAYLAEVAAWPVAAIVNLINSAGTYPVRELLYENLELPLYNAWAALHWYYAMSGFVSPMQSEINAGLNTLGVGVGDVWGAVQAALNDPKGGLPVPPPPAGSEPSGIGEVTIGHSPSYPHDVVTDPQSWLTGRIDGMRGTACGPSEAPSEFVRPWLWPQLDNEGDGVGTETPTTPASPYKAPQDATALTVSAAGNQAARADFESAQSEADTIRFASQHLPNQEHLGDPVDYTAYVVARLTRNNPGAIANFNLDADRGYGYLCWDWLRSDQYMATPSAWTDKDGKHSMYPPDQRRAYHAPLRPGAGWCDLDLAVENPPLPPQASDQRPTRHDPTDPKVPAVRIRYIDREYKFAAAPKYASVLLGRWDIWANGFASTLLITSIDDLGNVQGSVFDNLLTGFWDEESRTLTFLRIPNGANPATFQVYVGHMFQNQDGGFNFSLAGSFEAFAGTGATAQRAEFGWVAKPQAIS